MKVKKLVLDKYKFRYIVTDDEGYPILSVSKYLKYIDNLGRSAKTQKAYAYGLKSYFEYLKEINIDYKNINIHILSDFIAWLRNPYRSNKVITFKNVKSKISNNTINLTITAITNFYEYLYRTEQIEKDIVEKLMKQLFVKKRNSKYKEFLYHVKQNKETTTNILRQKIPKRKVKTLNRKEVETIYNAATNTRDKFLIKLLYETGLRIGEALSLHIEDFIFDHNEGHKIKLVDRGDLPNEATLKSGERDIDISQDLMDAFDDYAFEILDELEVDTNFLFVKIRGVNKGKPLEYKDVIDMFKRISKKTNIKVYPHLFRHTHATIYYNETDDIKLVQERLGHLHIQTTMDLYIHKSPKEHRNSWKKAESAFKINSNDISLITINE